MTRSPLYLRFANRELDAEQVVTGFIRSTQDEASKAIATDLLEVKGIYDVEDFREYFRNCLKDLIDNGAIPAVTEYLNAYMSSSLEEVGGHVGRGSYGTSSRYAIIKDAEAPWVEALVCYNLCLYIKGYGLEELKSCKTCGKFFCDKGKYATYCSEGCKSRKGGN